MNPTAHRVLLTVSGSIPTDARAQVASANRPRIDYLEMADAFGAELLDHRAATTDVGLVAGIVRRLGGADAALALRCFERRRQYDVIVTDGEQIGLPLAVAMRFTRRRPRHVMIVHRMSVAKKSLLFRALRLGGRIDEIVVYSSAQERFVTDVLRYPATQVTLSNFMVDTEFFAPDRVHAPEARTPVISSAGLEFRDYATLMEATRGLDVDVVLAAASPWSKRSVDVGPATVPANVRFVRLDLWQLRELYAASSVVVLPLKDVDFQAGVTTLLEAMAMGKPVICSRTQGQTDVISDRRNGLYVDVGDTSALRSAIAELLGDRELAQALGRAGREWVERRADIDVYVGEMCRLVERQLARA